MDNRSTASAGAWSSVRPGRGRTAFPPCAMVMLMLLVMGLPAASEAQTIDGVLLDRDSDRPIPLGLVMLYSEEGDSITATVTDEVGRFRIGSDAPGSFVLRAASLGYAEATDGVFDIGPGGSIRVEFRLTPAPLPIDEIAVAIDRPILEHHLVRNGFVRRLQRGQGLFVTPYDIERSPARSTESLLEGMPRVRVGPVYARQGGVGLPAPHLGEEVQIIGPDLAWCNPLVYVDGIRAHYDPSQGFNLSSLAHVGDVDAIEVYRRPVEMPVEFPVGSTDQCGLVVMWTKLGLAPGQRPQGSGRSTAYGDSPEGQRPLPSVAKTGPPPVDGESIRLQLAPGTPAGVPSPWVGIFLSTGPDALVARDDLSGRAVSIPIDAIEALHVSRAKESIDAYRRGLLWGGVAGAGTSGFLRLLCELTCRGGGDTESVALPGLVIGVVVAAMVTTQGPGREWVSTTPR